jgi:hypothetical protein
VIDTATNQVLGTPVEVGDQPYTSAALSIAGSRTA